MWAADWGPVGMRLPSHFHRFRVFMTGTTIPVCYMATRISLKTEKNISADNIIVTPTQEFDKFSFLTVLAFTLEFSEAQIIVILQCTFMVMWSYEKIPRLTFLKISLVPTSDASLTIQLFRFTLSSSIVQYERETNDGRTDFI